MANHNETIRSAVGQKIRAIRTTGMPSEMKQQRERERERERELWKLSH